MKKRFTEAQIDFTKECLTIDVDTSLPGMRVVSALSRLLELRGLLLS